MRRAAAVVGLGLALAAAPRAAAAEDRLGPSLQLDLGLAVVGAGVELPLASRAAIMLEGQVFSTYFAPWFDAGDRVDGFGGQVRATWFSRAGGHGLYLTPYLRVDRVTSEDATGAAVGFSTGAAVGWSFAATRRLDVRAGAGAQYLHYRLAPAEVTTPFVQLDLVVAYRL